MSLGMLAWIVILILAVVVSSMALETISAQLWYRGWASGQSICCLIAATLVIYCCLITSPFVWLESP